MRDQIVDDAGRSLPLRNLLSELLTKVGGDMRRKLLAKAPITEERWTVECEESFRSVKQGLASHVELAFPDDDEVLLVSTDASLHT